MTPTTSRGTRVAVDAALLCVLGVALIAVLVDVQPVRGIAVALACALVPGGAIVSRLGLPDALTAAAVAAGLSLAILTLATLALAWTGWWEPGALGLVLAVGFALLLLDNVRKHRAREAGAP